MRRFLEATSSVVLSVAVAFFAIGIAVFADDPADPADPDTIVLKDCTACLVIAKAGQTGECVYKNTTQDCTIAKKCTKDATIIVGSCDSACNCNLGIGVCACE